MPIPPEVLLFFRFGRETYHLLISPGWSLPSTAYTSFSANFFKIGKSPPIGLKIIHRDYPNLFFPPENVQPASISRAVFWPKWKSCSFHSLFSNFFVVQFVFPKFCINYCCELSFEICRPLKSISKQCKSWGQTEWIMGNWKIENWLDKASIRLNWETMKRPIPRNFSTFRFLYDSRRHSRCQNASDYCLERK